MSELRDRVRGLVGDEPMCYDKDDDTGEYGEEVTIFCNDFFWWACADCQEVTAETLPILEAACKDVEAVVGSHECADLLYCCRVRNLRPQGACYGMIPDALHALFNEAGPEREIDFGNPYTQNFEYEYKPEQQS